MTTSKLTNNHHWKQPENWLNRSLIMKDIKKMTQREEGWRHGMGRSQAHGVAINYQEGYLGCRGSPWGAHRVPVPHSGPQPGAPVPGKEVPITASLKTCMDCISVRQSSTGVPGLPLEGPENGLALSQTCSALQCRSSSLKGTRDIRGETKLTGFRVRAGGGGEGISFLGCKCWQAPFTPFWPLPHLASKHREVPNLWSPLTWFNTVFPAWCPLRPRPTQAQATSNSFSTQVADLD